MGGRREGGRGRLEVPPSMEKGRNSHVEGSHDSHPFVCIDNILELNRPKNVPRCLNSHISCSCGVIEAEISHRGFSLLLPCIPSFMEKKEKWVIRLQEAINLRNSTSKEFKGFSMDGCYFARYLVVIDFGIQLVSISIPIMNNGQQ